MKTQYARMNGSSTISQNEKKNWGGGVSTTSVKRSSIIMPNLVETGPTVWKHDEKTDTFFFKDIRAREIEIFGIYSGCE
jgi:hypothetical protein